MPGDGDFPRLIGVLVLPMTSALFREPPAVGFDQVYDVPEFHQI
jgi:hypothetical protein